MAIIRDQQPHPTQPGLIWNARFGRFVPSANQGPAPTFPGTGTVTPADLLGGVSFEGDTREFAVPGNFNTQPPQATDEARRVFAAGATSDISPTGLARQLQAPLQTVSASTAALGGRASAQPPLGGDTLARQLQAPLQTVSASTEARLPTATLINPITGETRAVVLDGTPQTSALMNGLLSGGFQVTGTTQGTPGDIIDPGTVETDGTVVDVGTGLDDEEEGNLGGPLRFDTEAEIKRALSNGEISLGDSIRLTRVLQGLEVSPRKDGSNLTFSLDDLASLTGKTRLPPSGDIDLPPSAGGDFPPPSVFTPDQDVREILTTLLNDVLAAGNISAEQFAGLQAQIDEMLNFTATNAAEREQITRDLIEQLLGTALPPLQEAIGRGNEGLSAEARASLETRAIEDPARIKEAGRRELTQLLQGRGAFGVGGETPGAPGQLAQFGELTAQAETLRSQGLTEIAIQDEAQRTLNREQALKASEITNQLLSTTGQIFDPTGFLNASADILRTSGATVDAKTQAQLNAFKTAADIINTRADLEPESLKGLITAGIFGSLPELIGLVPSFIDWINKKRRPGGGGGGDDEDDGELGNAYNFFWSGPSLAANMLMWDRWYDRMPQHIKDFLEV